jgi:hypothetical protein
MLNQTGRRNSPHTLLPYLTEEAGQTDSETTRLKLKTLKDTITSDRTRLYSRNTAEGHRWQMQISPDHGDDNAAPAPHTFLQIEFGVLVEHNCRRGRSAISF